ncbi:CDP-diacylglycerol--serine O-phosphatidyltransferase [Litoribacillus peritrichatus]|uniref:CDP-diacylglycerol--serine O-phosphatidyltransferase n=1 Tax=Litoribacillus peritrichatus TaxID=718191 RepID=A0ABP7NBK8_9GAMM
MSDVEKQEDKEVNSVAGQNDCSDTEGNEVKKAKHKGFYLLPNMFTTAALFSGFYAVVASMNGHFEKAAIAIFVAMILDGLDGRVARLTNTQSEFGAQYDSLSDMVAFGMAPALVSFTWALQSLGQIGWVASFIYVACAALRLARFNTQIDIVDKKYFIGLASPAAAAIVAGMVWAYSEVGVNGSDISWFAALVVAGSGILMVSNVKYTSFKDIDLKNKVPFIALISMVLVIALVSIDPARVLWIGFMVYAASGPVMFLNEKRKKSS